MREQTDTKPDVELEFAYDLDAPQEKVWRAISLPEFRQRWLPANDLMEPEPVSCKPGEEISYRLKEGKPPFIESEVTFRLLPNENNGTRLTIIHRIVDERLAQQHLKAANSNEQCLMRAA